MDRSENVYDEESGRWTTMSDRHAALMASRPEYVVLESLIRSDPEAAWPILVQLVGEIDENDDGMLDHVGADVMEDFVRAHAPAFIDRIEARALVDPRFEACLSYVWLSHGQLSAEIEQRLQRATHGQILILTPDGQE